MAATPAMTEQQWEDFYLLWLAMLHVKGGMSLKNALRAAVVRVHEEKV